MNANAGVYLNAMPAEGLDVEWPEVLWGAGYSTASRLRGWFRRLRFRRAGKRKKLRLVAAAIWWPIHCVFETRRSVREYGQAVKAAYDEGLLRQSLYQWLLALRYGIEPAYYYQYRLYVPERRRMATHYIPAACIVYLTRLLSKDYMRDESRTLDNKDLFRLWAHEYGLPTVRTYLEFFRGQVRLVDIGENESMPPGDLFSKLSDSRGGIGARMWTLAENGYDSGSGIHKSLEEVVAELRGESSAGIQHPKAATLEEGQVSKILLQPRLSPHASLKHFSTKSFCTVRVVTGRGADMKPSVLGAFLRLPADEAIVDKFRLGALAAEVNVEDGSLRCAVHPSAARCTEEHCTHPRNGAPIEGQDLPYWNEVVRIACEAQGSLKQIPAVGWDVAITDEGPLFLEANVLWGIDSFQAITGLPIGVLPYARHLLNLIRSKYRPGQE